ncbi:hypothetical protein QOZ80_2BG0190310 [Eleusine coracana subsp. coracana]|nr:hypothetical protein QOZ80_2BG0190310 [Eleusine coracana subsp. coracana]
MEPLEHKGSIESFINQSIRMQKSAYLACHKTEDILAMAIRHFHSSQSFYQEEHKCIKSWVEEVRLAQLQFARRTPLTIWIFMASIVFPLESCEARLAWIKCCLLVIVIDDFFEGGGSTEEIDNLFALIEKWEAHEEIVFCSKHVEILFCSIYYTSSKIGEKATVVQNRPVISHIAELWLNYLRANMTEVKWTRTMCVPILEEYMSAAEVTSTCCRLLNDLHTYKKESDQGYVNSVLIHAHRYGGSSATSLTAIEAAEKEIKNAIVASERELLRLVLKEGGSIPRQCKDIFWNTYKVSYLFYLEGDGFCSMQKLVAAADAVIYEPLQVTLPSV